jgi:hypothetical protein
VAFYAKLDDQSLPRCYTLDPETTEKNTAIDDKYIREEVHQR